MVRPSRRRHPGRLFSAEAQLERTALAWNRTVLVLAVNGALLVRMAEQTGLWAEVAGFTVLFVTLPIWVITNRAYRRVQGGPAGALFPRKGFTVGAVALVVAVGLLDLLAVLTHR